MPVTLPTNLTFYLELGLEILLALTLVYCVILERRLASVRKGQEGLKRTVGELNMAIAGAGASLRALKSAAGEAAYIEIVTGTYESSPLAAQLGTRMKEIYAT